MPWLLVPAIPIALGLLLPSMTPNEIHQQLVVAAALTAVFLGNSLRQRSRRSGDPSLTLSKRRPARRLDRLAR